MPCVTARCAPSPTPRQSAWPGSGAIDSCLNGFANCDGNSVNGCETPTGANNKNCGGCGVVCPQNLVCANGGCTCPQCNIPNAKSVCVNNVCTFDSCLPGFANCDNDPVNGCEVGIDSDSKNCGGCGMACGGQTPFCLGGVCSAGGLHCADILKAVPNAKSGVYTVDPDGNGGAAPFLAYCDMSTAGGGWTLALNLDTSDGHVMWWADPLWENNSPHGDVQTPFDGDHKSPAWSSLSGTTEILLVVHEQGRHARVEALPQGRRPHAVPVFRRQQGQHVDHQWRGGLGHRQHRLCQGAAGAQLHPALREPLHPERRQLHHRRRRQLARRGSHQLARGDAGQQRRGRPGELARHEPVLHAVRVAVVGEDVRRERRVQELPAPPRRRRRAGGRAGTRTRAAPSGRTASCPPATPAATAARTPTGPASTTPTTITPSTCDRPVRGDFDAGCTRRSACHPKDLATYCRMR